MLKKISELLHDSRYKPFHIFLFFFICILVSPSKAQTNPGSKIKKVPGGIEGRTGKNSFSILAVADNIFRVRISKTGSFTNADYALANPHLQPFREIKIEEKGSLFTLSTGKIICEVETSPLLHIAFKNKAGIEINADERGQGFGTSFTGEKVTRYQKLQEGERFVGMGEALGNLDKRGMGIPLNNTDNYKYGDPRVPMYISIPFFIGLHHGEAYGLFYNNTFKGYFNFGASNTRFASASFEGGEMDYFFLYDKQVAGILDAYTSITGRMPLPPKWSIGYSQSRCSYYPQQTVMGIARTFREKQIPLDCIVLDADYLQDYEPFRINTQRFPDMRGMADTLAGIGIELTASVNPGIKLDSSYAAYRDGLQQDVFLKYPDGTNYTALMDPSMNHYVDFTSAKGRSWWSTNLRFLEENGIHGYWNDMNEPAVSGQALPDNVVFDFDGKKAMSVEAKNVYGMQMARASFESAQNSGKGRRPFVLTRSAFAGVQRYSAVWSGDNQAKDEYLLSGVLLNAQMGLSGIPFTGPDLGGYIGDGNKELFRRWIEVGVFSPFVRTHREAWAAASEPWSYGEEDEAISKTFIEFRYRLLPYLYSKFYEASKTGIPIARSLCINYPTNAKVYDNLYQYQFLFGDAMLVVPVTPQEKTKKIYLPEGDWYDLYSDEKLSGSKEFNKEVPVYEVPVYIKESSIIPMQHIVQSTKNNPGDTLFIHIYHGGVKNSFQLYDDDGATISYQSGHSATRDIEFDPTKKEIRFSKQTGDYQSPFKRLQIILHGFGSTSPQFTLNGKNIPVRKTVTPVLDVLYHLEDIYDKGYMRSLKEQAVTGTQWIVETENISDEIVVGWK